MTAARNSPAGPAWSWKGPLALPSLGLLVLVLVFLWEPIANLGSQVYSPVDLTQRYPLISVQSGPHRVENEVLGDVVTEMEPWLRFNREELHRGRLPLINPYNGGGVPHLANAQSAVLSPFSLPHYFLSPKLALLLAALLKLVVAGGFMLLFLCALGLSGPAALVGAVGYAFCGHNILLLGYPHAGAAALLPAMLYFAERLITRHERGAGLERWSLVGLALSYAFCALAGQPEPLFFGALISAAYTAFRLIRRIRRAADRRRELRAVAPLVAGLAAAALCALAISAIEVLPFIEYMGFSLLAEQRSGVQTPLMRQLWPLYAYPDLLGNPSLSYYLNAAMPPINYEAANSGYVGALLLFAALVSWAFVARSAAHRLFAALMVVWIVWAYDLWGLNASLVGMPLIGIAPINRSQFVFALATSACAAFAVQGLIDLGPRRRPWAALGVAVGAAAAYSWFKVGAGHLLESAQDYVSRNPEPPIFPLADVPRAAALHRSEVHLVFGIGVLLLSGLALSPWRRVANVLAALLVACLFAQTGWLLRRYNPTIPDAEHFSSTPAIRELAAAVDGELLAIVGTEALPPSMNMPYEIPLLANYDGMWVSRYDDLYRARFGAESNWRTINQADLQSLRLFGAHYALTLPGWTPLDTLFPRVPWNPRSFMDLAPFTFGSDVVQMFTVPSGSLSGIRLWFDTHGQEHDGLLALHLRDAESFELLGEMAVQCRDLVPGPNGHAELVFRFDPVPRTPERLFRLRIECQEQRSGPGVTVVARLDMVDWQNQMLHDQERRWQRASRAEPLPSIVDPANAHHALARWKLYQSGTAVGGGLAFDLCTAAEPLEPVRDIGPYRLWRVPDASRYRLIADSIVVPTRAAARRELDHPEFDPTTSVVIEDPGVQASYRGPRRPRLPGQLQVIEEDARSTTFHARLSEPAWLVTSKPWIPGWKAEIGERRLTTACANEGFLAVALPVGEHDLILWYDPASVRIGGWLTVLGLAGLVALFRGLRPRAARASGP